MYTLLNLNNHQFNDVLSSMPPKFIVVSYCHQISKQCLTFSVINMYSSLAIESHMGF